MINRELDLYKYLKKNASCFIFGARGTGKSILVNSYLSTKKNSLSYNLLLTDLFEKFLKTPQSFRIEIESRLETKKEHLIVFVDEIQKLPNLLNEVHYLMENNKNRISFILTGSSARKLKKQGADMLAGRAWMFNLYPFSIREFKADLTLRLQYGTLPVLFGDKLSYQPEDNILTLKTYVSTYLREEIQQEALTRNLQSFAKFLDYAGQMNAEPVNFTKISKIIGVSVPTTQEYFQILVDTLIVNRIDGWSESKRKQLQIAPKFYFFDCGVLNQLTGEIHAPLLESSFRFGKLFETLIIQELIKLNSYHSYDFQFYYWRTSTGIEVDLILKRGKTIKAIEIKSAFSIAPSDLKSLNAFSQEYSSAELFVVYRETFSETRDDIKIISYLELNTIFS